MALKIFLTLLILAILPILKVCITQLASMIIDYNQRKKKGYHNDDICYPVPNQGQPENNEKSKEEYLERHKEYIDESLNLQAKEIELQASLVLFYLAVLAVAIVVLFNH